MPLTILCLGKTKQTFIQDGIDEYNKRISSFIKLTWKIVDDVKLKKNMQVSDVKEMEAKRIIKMLSTRDYIIALDEKGEKMSSPFFAKNMSNILSQKGITFIIGGVYGLDKSVLERADLVLSFSNLTFTHQMIRLLLSEQIYRALTIIKGKKYHY